MTGPDHAARTTDPLARDVGSAAPPTAESPPSTVLGPPADVRLQTTAKSIAPADPGQMVDVLRMSEGWAALGPGLGAGALGGSELWSSRRSHGART